MADDGCDAVVEGEVAEYLVPGENVGVADLATVITGALGQHVPGLFSVHAVPPFWSM